MKPVANIVIYYSEKIFLPSEGLSVSNKHFYTLKYLLLAASVNNLSIGSNVYSHNTL